MEMFVNDSYIEKTISEATSKLKIINNKDSVFWDVQTKNYFYDAVLWAVENAITNGTSSTTFSPNYGCTRGQVVTFLWRAAGEPSVTSSNSFTDVKENAYYADAVKWAVQNGITQGVGNNRFDPNANCTRGQIVTFLWRYKGEPEASTDSGFSDVSSSQYYAAPVTWAVQNKITQGVGNNRFAPNDTCTRGQIVTFLYRAKDISSLNPVNPAFAGNFAVVANELNLRYGPETSYGKIQVLHRGDEVIGYDSIIDGWRYVKYNDQYGWMKDNYLEKVSRIEHVNIGDYVTFGHYEQDDDEENGLEPIEWKVLDLKDNSALIISRYCLDCQPFNSNTLYDISWENSTLRNWLNEIFYNTAFKASEKSKILTTTVVNKDNPNPIDGVKGGNDTLDSVFLLSNEEAKLYFSSENDRISYPTAYARNRGASYYSSTGGANWWLRSPGIKQTNADYGYNGVQDVSGNGVIISAGTYAHHSNLGRAEYNQDTELTVRPAMWVNLAS